MLCADFLIKCILVEFCKVETERCLNFEQVLAYFVNTDHVQKMLKKEYRFVDDSQHTFNQRHSFFICAFMHLFLIQIDGHSMLYLKWILECHLHYLVFGDTCHTQPSQLNN